jgi:hypothetical protein
MAEIIHHLLNSFSTADYEQQFIQEKSSKKQIQTVKKTPSRVLLHMKHTTAQSDCTLLNHKAWTRKTLPPCC